ncbi:MAG: ABC transporter ATP-binding protein, partial [Acidobacteriota bacterium]
VAYDEPHRLKRSIGGDVVVVRCRQPEHLRERLEERLRITPSLVDGVLRIEAPRGHQLLHDMIEAFPGEILSASWGQPTLEDVFVHRTGRRFMETEP